MKLPITICFILLILVSCRKKENTGYDARFRGTLEAEFDNVAGDQDLKLNTGTYTNAAGESFSVRSLRYYISNIKLAKTDGSEYVVPQDSSYFLVDESIPTSSPILKIPEGEYNGLTFTVGVDSLRSTMNISQQKGALIPTVANYLNENNGYIHFSMEGNAAVASQNRFEFEIAGYGGKTSPTINNIKTIAVDLSAGGIAKIREGKTTTIHLMADILKVFTGTEQVSLATQNIIGFEPYSTNIANNYALMFRHDHTHNQ